MHRTATAPTHTRTALAGLAVGSVVVTAIVATLLHQSASSSTSAAADLRRDDHGGTTVEDDGAVVHHDDGVIDHDDGVVPDGVTAFDDEYPGIGNLDPDLLQAVRDAATDAAADGIELHVTSGWRSPEYQGQLLREAVSEYGSEEEAARWVATASTSLHVSGNAIDIGPFDAMAWLFRHGADYGLCQTYSNEPWHYELHPQAVDHGCPAMYPDPLQDPRMRP